MTAGARRRGDVVSRGVLVALLAGVFGVDAAAPGADSVEQTIAAACGKNIVLLGELPSHGEALTFNAKAAIVRGLVERCGFDAVLFEAPMYEFEARASTNGLDARSTFDDAVTPFWSTPELAAWRDWLAGAASTGTIHVGGLDDQPGATSKLTRRWLPDALAPAWPQPARDACTRTVTRHLEWKYSADAPFDAAEKQRLFDCARLASAQADAHPHMAARGAARAFADYAARQAGRIDAPARDESMHSALHWHLARLDRDAKVVVWTSTVHAARAVGGRPYTPLGALIAQHRGARMMSIGFTALAGESSMAGGPVRALEPAPADSLERRALPDDAASVYLGASHLGALDGSPSRLYGQLSRHPWAGHFDAVIVFRHERAPVPPAAPPPR